MAGPAVGEDDDAVGVVEDVRILRPAVLDDHSMNLRHVFVEVVGQQQAAGAVFMLSIAVARVPGDKYDFLLPLAVWLAGTERRLGGKLRGA